MKVIVANKDDYIKFNAMLLDKMKTFELTEDATDYIIHRVKLGDETQDVSLMDSCINNLLEEQYEKREYIKIEEIQVINNLISKLNENECRILNAYAEIKRYSIKNLNKITELITNINDYQIIEKYNLHELGKLIAQKDLEQLKKYFIPSYQEFAITIYQTKEEIESDWMETCKLINKHSTSDLQPIEEYRIMFSSNGRSVSLRSNKYNGYPSALIFIKEIDNETRLRYGYIELHLGMKKGTDKLIPLMI